MTSTVQVRAVNSVVDANGTLFYTLGDQLFKLDAETDTNDIIPVDGLLFGGV